MASLFKTERPITQTKPLLMRYKKFIEVLDNTEVEPIKVFEPLPKELVDNLTVIREVSQKLQEKKDEDVNKAAQTGVEVKPKEPEAETKDEEKKES